MTLRVEVTAACWMCGHPATQIINRAMASNVTITWQCEQPGCGVAWTGPGQKTGRTLDAG